MKSATLLLLCSSQLIPFVNCDWTFSFNQFVSLQYWYGDDNSGTVFNPLRWLGGNGQWFPGPNVYNIDPNPPAGCSVDQAVYVLRHGSRYPDPSAYAGWVTLYDKIQNSTFTATGPLSFLKSWKPVVANPSLQDSTESITGYREAFDLGVSLRTRYPTFFTPGVPFHVFANDYPRVVETAQNFLRAYGGVNASYGGLGQVYAVNSKAAASLGDSLSPSDLCPNYVDNSGVNQTNVWTPIYANPVLKRLARYIHGSLNLTTIDVASMAYLCGFETSITGTPSPWCPVLTESEYMGYEYAQDLRYYYGNGIANPVGRVMMFPFLISVTDLLTTYGSTNTANSSNIQPLTMAFLNDGQISQLVSEIGVFDDQPVLPNNAAPTKRLYYASRFVSMRGTIAFERLSCPTKGSHDKYVRIKLNDAVYTVPSCKGGPGGSCALNEYHNFIAEKNAESGGFLKACGANTTATNVQTNFWTQYAKLPFVREVNP